MKIREKMYINDLNDIGKDRLWINKSIFKKDDMIEMMKEKLMKKWRINDRCRI
jgi:hypothetical protein